MQHPHSHHDGLRKSIEKLKGVECLRLKFPKTALLKEENRFREDERDRLLYGSVPREFIDNFQRTLQQSSLFLCL